MTILQIEHVNAIRNLEGIALAAAKSNAIDSLFIGPADLSASMGILGEYSSKEFADVVDTALKKCNEIGVSSGIHTFSPEDALKRISQGFKLIVLGSDVGMIGQSFSQSVDKVRNLIAPN